MSKAPRKSTNDENGPAGSDERGPISALAPPEFTFLVTNEDDQTTTIDSNSWEQGIAPAPAPVSWSRSRRFLSQQKGPKTPITRRKSTDSVGGPVKSRLRRSNSLPLNISTYDPPAPPKVDYFQHWPSPRYYMMWESPTIDDDHKTPPHTAAPITPRKSTDAPGEDHGDPDFLHNPEPFKKVYGANYAKKHTGLAISTTRLKRKKGKKATSRAQVSSVRTLGM